MPFIDLATDCLVSYLAMLLDPASLLMLTWVSKENYRAYFYSYTFSAANAITRACGSWQYQTGEEEHDSFVSLLTGAGCYLTNGLALWAFKGPGLNFAFCPREVIKVYCTPANLDEVIEDLLGKGYFLNHNIL
jgi:hypothetical protein